MLSLLFAPPALADVDDNLVRTPPPTDFCASSLSECAAVDAALAAGQPGLPLLVQSSQAEVDGYVAEALRWAPCNGLLMRAASEDEEPTAAECYVHAPFALLPAEYPASELERACALAPSFNRLVDAVAADLLWLEATLRETAASDVFTRRLLRLALRVASEGPTQSASLGVLRSDYMLHEPEPADGAAPAPPQLLQVELNTIASSFAALSCAVSDLHQHLATRWPALRAAMWERRGRPPKLTLSDALPPNDAVDAIADALAAAHRAHGGADAVVLFVVQPGERNAVDQHRLSQRLYERHGVRTAFRSLSHLDQSAKLEGPRRRLLLDGTQEVSVAYFRAGYVPDDYPSNKEWSARLLLERSLAIKCPSAAYQLAGAKKVQQQLALPGELERFVSPAEAEAMRRVFAGLWSLSGDKTPPDDAPPAEREAAEAMRAAAADPSGYVMKPQREGGGHNLFGATLAAALRELSRAQRSAYILMRRIEPKAAPAVLVRAGEVYRGDAVSELGVYSTYLRSATGRVLISRPAGHLVRTKMRGVDEGGVASGFAVLSSPLASSDDVV